MPLPTTECFEPYSSDLSDLEWSFLSPLLPIASRLGRPARYDRRLVLNAIFYVVRSGCAWRLLPHDLPPWRLCYHYFAFWQESGLWEQINDALRNQVRLLRGKKKPPALDCFASLTLWAASGRLSRLARLSTHRVLKWANHPGVRGYDAGKKIRGRKRHLVVDTLGLVLGVAVTAASLSDRAGALEVLPPILRAHAGLELLWADAGYAGGTLAADLQAHAAHPDLRLEIIKRSDAAPKGFAVQPRRWVVERSFGWLMQARRLARDYETKPTSSKAIILAQSIRIMLRSLAK